MVLARAGLILDAFFVVHLSAFPRVENEYDIHYDEAQHAHTK